MAKRYYLSEDDRRVLIEMKRLYQQIRISGIVDSFPRDVKMSPETYISRGSVPARSGLVPGKAILPIYKLMRSDDSWIISPVILPDGKQMKLEVLNVRPCETPDDYNYIHRDKFGRWHVEYHVCVTSSYSSMSSSFSSSSSMSSASSFSSSSVVSSAASSSMPSSARSVSSASISRASASASAPCYTIPGLDFDSLPELAAGSGASVLGIDENGCLGLIPITECP